MEGRSPHPPSRPTGSQVQDGHNVTLRAREEAVVSGVVHVTSFDDRQIVLGTQMGTLTITGHELQIRELDLGQGSFRVQGGIDALVYSAGGKGRGRREGHAGVLRRLLQ